jgi:hypothetical protein
VCPAGGDGSPFGDEPILTNTQFTGGSTTGWTLNGTSENVYVPTSTQYTIGSGPNGSGTEVVSIPSAAGGGSSGQFYEFLPSCSQSSCEWAASTTYTFTFWIGVPLGDTSPSTVEVQFGDAANLAADGLPSPIVLTAAQIPSAGQWMLDTVSFTTPSSGSFVGKPIGIGWAAAGSSNGEEVNFAIPVPGPLAGAGLPGLVAACGGLLVLARRRRQRIA